MNPTLTAGALTVTAALAAYSTSVFAQVRANRADHFMLGWLTSGVVLDVTATGLMIAGSTNTPLTVHGMLGYSALTLMIVDTVLLWKHRRKKGVRAPVSSKLRRYSLAVYGYWVIVYVIGAVMASRAAG
jgi:EamA domain-containing membrane protein RarD